MTELGFWILFGIWVITFALALWQWYMKRSVIRHVNRRLVAYEGKLRDLGHSPDRVYHDFENMLDGSVDDRQSPEFNTETAQEGEN